MTKEKMNSLMKHVSNLKDKLNGPVPPKHAHRPTQYHNFLRNDIATTEATIEKAKLEGATDKK